MFSRTESAEVIFYDLVLLTSRIVGSHAPVQQISEGRFPMMDSSTTSFSQCKNKLLNKEYRPIRVVITHRVVYKCPACWSWCWVDPSEPWVWEVLPCQQFSFAFQQRMTYYSPSPLIYCTSPPSTVCCHLSSGSLRFSLKYVCVNLIQFCLHHNLKILYPAGYKWVHRWRGPHSDCTYIPQPEAMDFRRHPYWAKG